MAPRTKQCKNRAPGTDEPAEKVKVSGWERSKISTRDQKMLKKMGFLKTKEALKMPGDESTRHPNIGFRVTFVDFLVRGLAVPVHEFLRGLLFIYGIQLHQLTPNSLLHISIFTTLCECFLGIHPHWGLWKRIFYLRRNNSRNVIYNVGGVCICVRPDVDYFDMKFPNSVQGWRKKWLYIQDESSISQEYGLAPFDPTKEIQRRISWDTEATAEEKAATEALMTRIHELQNTDGQELSGVQIIAYFLRIRVQPLQARKNPLWMYADAKDVDRISKDLSVKDLERLVRRFTSLNKNHNIPSSYCVEPYSGSHALPEGHQILSSLPSLPEGGEVDGRVVVTDDSQESSLPESEAVESQKSAGSSEKETESEQHSESAHSISPPLATSPDGRKRKRDNVEDSGASKIAEPAAEESSPEEQSAFDPFADAGAVSSSDEGAEEEEPAAHGPAPTSTSNTLVLSEEHRTAAETLPPPQHHSKAPTPVPSPRAPLAKKARTGAGSTQDLATGSTSAPLLEDPLMKELVNLGSRFIGFHNEAATLRDALRRAEERADALEVKLKTSETARKKAEKDAAAVESLRQRLQTAEDALSDKEAQQVERENATVERFETQNRRFTRRMGEKYTLNQDSDDRLLDALEILELNCDLARTNISSARAVLKKMFPHFFPKDTQPEIFSQLTQHFLAKEDPALAYRQASLKIGVEGTIALVAASDQEVDWVKAGTPKGINKEKWKALVKDVKPHSKKLIAFLDPTSSASASTVRMELICDNYTGAAGPSNAPPAVSHSARAPGGVYLDDSSCADSILEEVADLRQQLQAMKKQAVTVMDQSRKSSDREQAALRQAQEALELKESATASASRAAQHENYMLDLMTDASQDMAGSFLDTAAEEQRDLVAQVWDFLDFCTNTLAMVYNAMFPRNPQPDNLPELMGKFKDVHHIHGFVKAQMIAGAKFALIWLKICHLKLDIGNVIDVCYSKLKKRRRNIDKLNAEVSPVAEKMIEELLRIDTALFKEYHYADTQNAPAAGENINIDDLI
ncbi:hypothetical protein QYE76_008835 [Lolium multiflorum]|uniref:Transposase (putative) gypsy type domain-containing protein n=1 Tax=Lolium multiflorum TaxID=4521 RepID=A0AAD8TTX0_LOLMU|nr:hypothetical protein QYE76_008835 [Lolium multiflorum]